MDSGQRVLLPQKDTTGKTEVTDILLSSKRKHEHVQAEWLSKESVVQSKDKEVRGWQSPRRRGDLGAPAPASSAGADAGRLL